MFRIPTIFETNFNKFKFFHYGYILKHQLDHVCRVMNMWTIMRTFSSKNLKFKCPNFTNGSYCIIVYTVLTIYAQLKRTLIFQIKSENGWECLQILWSDLSWKLIFVRASEKVPERARTLAVIEIRLEAVAMQFGLSDWKKVAQPRPKEISSSGNNILYL